MALALRQLDQIERFPQGKSHVCFCFDSVAGNMKRHFVVAAISDRDTMVDVRKELSHVLGRKVSTKIRKTTETVSEDESFAPLL